MAETLTIAGAYWWTSLLDPRTSGVLTRQLIVLVWIDLSSHFYFDLSEVVWFNVIARESSGIGSCILCALRHLLIVLSQYGPLPNHG